MKSNFLKLATLSCLVLSLLSCTKKPGTEAKENSSPMTEEVSDSVNITPQDFISYSKNAVIGETIYVPVYSHIYQQNARRTFNLTTTLSVRNTDLRYPITLTKVYYYDSKGRLVQKYLKKPIILNPLSSTSFVVEEEDLRGGVGANFLVLWEAQKNVTQPVIEAVMISTAQSQGISFVSKSRTIHTLNKTSLK